MVGKSGQPFEKGRNYGESTDDLKDRLDFVAALLALADDEITIPPDKLKAQFKLEWVKTKADELRISGFIEQKQRNGQIKPIEKGIHRDDLGVLLETYRNTTILKAARKEIIQNALDCLRDLGILKEHESAKNQGYWKFSLCLKHETAKKEENLQVIQDKWNKWKEYRGKLPDFKPIFQPTALDKWQEICQQNLVLQKKLTTNHFTNAYGWTPQLDEIYVPLAIVERQPPKHLSRNQQEEKEAEKEAEKLIPIAEKRFFEDVLRQGKSQISQGRKIAIIGEPGSGKTTRLQKIADWILEQDLGLPIWVSLADVTQATITQYIKEIWLNQTGKSLTIDELTQHKERIWLLLDGLDEMTSRVEMCHVSTLLGGWVQGARVVVTCRVNVWDADKNAFSGFDVFRNLEFNPEQVTNYIGRWFTAMGDVATGESLEAELQSNNSRLKELIHNPLRLWMLCQIWQTGGGLPETQAGLYAQFVNWVYRWKADEEILDQREAIDKALAQLAWAAMEQKDEVSRLRLPESWVLKLLGSRPIFKAVEKLGWLNRVERFPEAICVFYHSTFQEYFAALAVENWDDFLPRTHEGCPVQGKRYRIFEPQWKQVILLWLGREDVGDEEKEAFIQKLVNFEDGCGDWSQIPGIDKSFYGFQSYFLAVACSSEFKSAVFQEIIDIALNWSFGGYSSKNDDYNFSYLDIISESAQEFIINVNKALLIPVLLDCLEDSSCKSQKSNIGVFLKNLKHLKREYLQKLESLLGKKSIDRYTQSTIIGILGEVGDKKSIICLINQLSSIEDDLSRRLIAGSILQIDPHQATAQCILSKIKRTSSNELAKILSVVTLEEVNPNLENSLEETLHFKILKDLILNSVNPDIRHRAILYLEIFQNSQNKKSLSRSIHEIIEQCQNKKEKLEIYLAALNMGIVYPKTTQILLKIIIDSFAGNSDYFLLKSEAFYLICQQKDLIDHTGTIEFIVHKCLQRNELDLAAKLSFILGQVSYKNQKAIGILESIIEKTQNFPHSLSIQYLCQLTQNSRYLDLLSDGFLDQNRFHQDNQISTCDQFLIEMIINSKNIIEPLQLKNYIQKCKKQMSHIEYKNNILRFYSAYQFLWKCAENLPYPEFYQAWHYPPTTPHPEVGDKTPIAATPFTQQCNLVLLPQILNQALQSHPLNCQIICIDGSRFSDPSNPALQIYTTLKKAGCTASPDGKPDTIAKLQAYCEDDLSDQAIALILYEEPTNPPPQGFDMAVLNQLARFSHPPIALVVPDRLAECRLPQFLESDPNLVRTILQWLQNLEK
ncbi:NACHT domain-containing protein [Oscillatoria acuminata]|uniref:Putative NTPase (NACHT family) n=1 Tax=Oscillatoria acuminata PCC 6304 TaxID=56110 RepID=K9TDG0_9CYAN|nr:NACHT domain-containing protein [Oscillatoria acuminata]AFY80902.1 putative NTPase (NACHT family) [Oscillatoria acuminata PCC 6304]